VHLHQRGEEHVGEGHARQRQHREPEERELVVGERAPEESDRDREQAQQRDAVDAEPPGEEGGERAEEREREHGERGQQARRPRPHVEPAPDLFEDRSDADRGRP
jgi:hypothetical protein